MPHITNTDIRRLVTAQRNRLGDLVETLDDAAWNRLSLCAGWRVQDVVAHCTQSHVATPWRVVTELITSGFSLTARNERWVAARRQHDRSTILAEYRATADRLAVPAAELPYALVEVVIHGYDIAWPVNRTVEVPTASLVIVADACRRAGLFLHAKQRCAGLTLHARDIAWSSGAGPEITGPLSSIIMAIAGRSQALGDLSGQGLDTLRSRL